MAGDKFLTLNNGEKMPIIGIGTWQVRIIDNNENVLKLSFKNIKICCWYVCLYGMVYMCLNVYRKSTYTI